MRHSRLERLALQWVPGEGPVQIEPLSSGLVNLTCRVTRAARSYSMRVSSAEHEDFGVDRAWECRVLARAAAAGVAPPIVHCEPAAGILIVEWVSGSAWTVEEIRTPEMLAAMAGLLRRVHSLPIPVPARSMAPAAWIALYEAALGGPTAAPAASQFRAAATARLALVACYPPAAVLCHSDLHRFNVARGLQPVLLDWEYAHVSDPFWDLAGWIANNDGTEDFAALFLASYLCRSPAGSDIARLRLWGWLYDYVCLLWSQVYLRRGSEKDDGAVAERAERLTQRLARASGGRAGQDPAH